MSSSPAVLPLPWGKMIVSLIIIGASGLGVFDAGKNLYWYYGEPVVLSYSDLLNGKHAGQDIRKRKVLIKADEAMDTGWDLLNTTRYNYTPWVEKKEIVARYFDLHLGPNILLAKTKPNLENNEFIGALFPIPHDTKARVINSIGDEAVRAVYLPYMLDATWYDDPKGYGTIAMYIAVIFIVGWWSKAYLAEWKLRVEHQKSRDALNISMN